jgi:hypothetical protein
MVEGLEQKLGVSMPDLESPQAKDFLLDLVREFCTPRSGVSLCSLHTPEMPGYNALALYHTRSCPLVSRLSQHRGPSALSLQPG